MPGNQAYNSMWSLESILSLQKSCILLNKIGTKQNSPGQLIALYIQANAKI